MDRGFQLFPIDASNFAGRVDALFWFLTAISAFFTFLIATLIIYFALKYRRRAEEPGVPVEGSTKLEVAWTVIPLLIVMVIFFWSARIYYDMQRPPDDAMEIHVIGKQWMWKIQHPTGHREINSLHVPRGRPIKLLLASQDVIHSFYIPAFRIKMDAVPGRQSMAWFTPTRTGTYHLFCAEYCGAEHSRMIGQVVVMDPAEYASWLAGVPADDSPIDAGRELFTKLGCITCHGSVAPTLAGLYGRPVTLAGGQTVQADENYLRESILDSTAKIVAGYAPVMPSFRGQVTEEQLLQLIAYIKSLREPMEAEIR